jgi:hypothetical protein
MKDFQQRILEAQRVAFIYGMVTGGIVGLAVELTILFIIFTL